MRRATFEAVGGSRDGTDTVRFEGVTEGARDGQGVRLDDVGPVGGTGTDLFVFGRQDNAVVLKDVEDDADTMPG